MNTKKQQRRTGALNRLLAQLKSGVKPTANGTVKLTEKDEKRIKSEIETLKKRV